MLSLESLRHRPAVLSVLVSLYEKQNNIPAAIGVLEEAEAALQDVCIITSE